MNICTEKTATWQRHQGIIVWKLDMHVRKFIDRVWRSRKFPKTFTYARVIRLAQKRVHFYRISRSEAYWKRTKMSASAVNWCLPLDKFMNYVTWVNSSRPNMKVKMPSDERNSHRISFNVWQLVSNIRRTKPILNSQNTWKLPNCGFVAFWK